ncbi:MAG: YbaK/EbsC family protein [Gammaproteobacteria bacterium]|jgi:prolyl-tRNA editing enzyme YbaK/EbsC (Cys-tRNA(Pro) deacylase)|nr:YbaK/EbsC family protein [Gammaproteobacteria bacterium]
MLKTSANQVQIALKENGFDFVVKELPASTRTANDAAQAVGCSVAEIAKSIIFRTVISQQPILVIASGINRINTTLIENALGENIEQPDGKWVKETLGFAIGGVPPIGFHVKLKVFIDQDLLKLKTIWAAAGTPNAVFSLPAKELMSLTGGNAIAVC